MTEPSVAPADAKAADAPKPRKLPALKPLELMRADVMRGYFFCTVAPDVTFEDVMTPAFWHNHVGALGLGPGARPWARIEVIAVDGSMDLDLRVIEVKPGMVKVRCLRKYVEGARVAKHADDQGAVPDLPDGYKITHVPQGENKGFMIRMGNGDVLVKGKLTRREAVEAAIAHAAEANRSAAVET